MCVRPGRWQWHLLPPAAAAIDRKIVLFLRPATASPVSVTTDAEQTTLTAPARQHHTTHRCRSHRGHCAIYLVCIYLPRPWARVTGPCAPRDPPPPGTGGRQAVTDRQVAPSRRRGKPDERFYPATRAERNATAWRQVGRRRRSSRHPTRRRDTPPGPSAGADRCRSIGIGAGCRQRGAKSGGRG